MPKRKRQTNPFLTNTVVVPSCESSTVLDRHLVAFVDESKHLPSRALSVKCAVSVDAVVTELETVLAGSDCSDSSPVFSEAAALLLPWATQLVLTNQGRPRTLVFRTLCVCLEFLQRFDGDETGPGSPWWHRLLTQSTLHKLVPTVAQVAVECNASGNDPSSSEDSGDDAEGVQLLSTTKDLHVFAGRALDVLLTVYTPTLDVACRSTLLPLVESMDLRHLYSKRHNLGEDPTMTRSAETCAVILSRVLTWLWKRTAAVGANPKTTFSVFASPATLLALTRCHTYFDLNDRAGVLLCGKTVLDLDTRQEIVEKLMCVVFDAKHLDGFRSLLLSQRQPIALPSTTSQSDTPPSQPSSFRSYQEELFTGLLASLSLSGSGDLAPGDLQNRVELALDMVKVVPVLLNGFMVRADEWFRQHRSTKGSSQRAEFVRSEVIVRLQFRMFERLTHPVRLLVTDAVKLDQGALVTVALSSLAACLEILAMRKAYVAAHDDPDRQQFQLLERMTLAYLDFPVSDAHYQGLQQLGCVLAGSRWLVQLDHRVVEGRLANVYSLLCACRDARLSTAVSSLLVSLVDMHSLLRQQTCLFESLLLLIADDSRFNENDLHVLIRHFNEGSVRQAIATAVRACPSTQAVHQLQAIDATIDTFCGERELKEGEMNVLTFVVQLLTSHIRLDSGNIADIENTCRASMEGPVSRLFDKSQCSGDRRLTAKLTSLSLCGMYLGLQERCTFLGNSSALSAIPRCFLELTDSWLGRVKGDFAWLSESDAKDLDDLADGLVEIWCHRLRELHSKLHELDILSGVNDLEEMRLLSVAKGLTVLVIEAAYRQKEIPEGSMSRWALISTRFSIWLPYASDRYLCIFLNWLFNAIIIDPNSSYLPSASSGLSFRSSFVGQDIESQVASRLLKDSSFLRHSRITSRLHCAATTCSLHCVKWILDSVDVSREDLVFERLKKLVGLDCLSEEHVIHMVHWVEDRTPNFLASSSGLSNIEPWLLRSVRPLRVINGLPHLECGLENAREFYDAAFRLDHVFRSLARTKLRSAAVGCIGIVRLSMALTLRPHSLQALPPALAGPQRVFSYYKSTLISALSLYADRPEDSVSQQMKALSIGTSALIRQLTRTLLAESDVSSPIDMAIMEFMRQLLADFGHVSPLLLMLCRSIISLAEESACKSNVRLAQSLRDILWEFVAKLSPFRNDDNSRQDAAFETWLVLGDLILLSDRLNLGSWPMEELLFRLLDSALEGVTNPNPETDVDIQRGCRYFVACVATTSPLPRMSDHIMKSILGASRPEDPFLAASFCQLAAKLSSNSINEWLKSLFLSNAHSDRSSHRSSRAHFLRLFLQSFNKAEHASVVSAYGVQMLECALSRLHGCIRDEESTHSAMDACSIVKELIFCHELLPLRRRDLARIMSHMSSILGSRGVLTSYASEKTGCGNGLSTDQYLHCSEVLLAMFQRYTKHLYACVPSVISMLHTFMDRILYDASGVTNYDITRRGQSFSRLCEVLVSHKDIYKKHVIGLILEFVHAMEVNLSSHRKEALLPAVFSLLDCLTEFETKQLNSLLSTKGRPLFQGIDQAYQRLHAYKGH